jgi:hypothetical protein
VSAELPALLERLARDGIDPHAEAIAEIASRRAISIVVVEPSDEWKDALRAHGWRGECVFAMSDRVRMALSCADPVTERWIHGSRSDTLVARIFAVIHDTSLLVNRDDRGLRIEPGSTD